MEEPKWIERARETYAFHRSKLQSNDKWNITKTAKSLRRSLGSVNEDIMIAKWLRTKFENEICKFEYAYEALEFIRAKKKEMEML